MIKRLVLVAAIGGLSAPVLAQVSVTPYAGIGMGFFQYEDEAFDDDLSLTALSGRLGVAFNEFVSAEGRVGFGVGDDQTTLFNTEVDLELDNYFGVYLRGGLPLNELVRPYALIGYTSGELTLSGPGGSVSEDESDVSYGVGVDFLLDNGVTLNGEYTNYLEGDGYEITGFSLSIAKSF